MQSPHPPPSTRRALRAPGRGALGLAGGLLAVFAVLAGCASGPAVDIGDTASAVVLGDAREALEGGRAEESLETLLALRERRGLAPELRNELEALLEKAWEARVAELRGAPGGADELLDLAERPLPRRLASRTSIEAARAFLERGERLDAYEAIVALDERDPGHFERGPAAEILATAGMSLAADPGRYFLGLRAYKNLAPRVLEYLVLHYPSHPSCAQAYDLLADHYEAKGQWQQAIARREELILYHRDSSYAVASELKIPELRIAQLTRDDYDRGGMKQALREVTTWLERHAGHELEEEARALQARCLRRLAASDMIIARFYRQVEEPYGAWQHAERALDEARRSGDEALTAEIRAFLAELPPPEEVAQTRDDAARDAHEPPAEGTP